MSSLKQIEANRRNALRSTGPTTQEGKERSRCNAVRHGLTAETIIAALENAEDYQAFEANVIADYDAETAVERELVLRLASVLWRLRRATGIETALFEFATEESWQGPLRPTLAEEQPDSAKPILPTPHGQTTPAGKATGLHSNKGVADCFLRLAALPTFPLDRLSRYERTLWRQARQIMITLESLRRRKPQPRRSSFPFSFRRPEPDRGISDELE
jgi:hypothetical protein